LGFDAFDGGPGNGIVIGIGGYELSYVATKVQSRLKHHLCQILHQSDRAGKINLCGKRVRYQ